MIWLMWIILGALTWMVLGFLAVTFIGGGKRKNQTSAPSDFEKVTKGTYVDI